MAFFLFIIYGVNGCSSSQNLVKEAVEMPHNFELIQVASLKKVQSVNENVVHSQKTATHPLKGVEKENCFLPSRMGQMDYCSLLTPIEDVFGRTKADYHRHSLTEIEKLMKSAEARNRSQQYLQVEDENTASQVKAKKPSKNEEFSQAKSKKSLEIDVLATAYNSVPSQTDGTPNRAAWGDRLKPGMKSIAVSRDLLKMGFTRGVKVKIEGLPGTYVVLDKMHSRWRKKIDIYMGKNIGKARKWGKRRVTISR